MNVLVMNYGLDVGGQEAHVCYLCNDLAGRRFGVTLWTKGGEFERTLSGCAHERVRFDQLVPWPRRLLEAHPFRRRLRDFVRRLDRVLVDRHISIVHTHGVTETVLTRAALEPHRVPLLYSSHGWPFQQWRWHMTQLTGCDHYVGVSRFTTRMLKSFGIPASRVSCINYGIPYTVAPSPAAIADVRARLLENPGRDLLVATVARLHRQKGHDVLLRAIPAIVKRVPNAVFAFVGDGPERRALEALAAALRIADRVRFVGMRDDVPEFLHAADAFCLPSRYEALPLSIPEAYRAALPVVVTDVGGNAEIVVAGKTGYVVEPERPQALADALIRLLTDDSRRYRMSKHAERFGRSERFDPERRHSDLARLYERIIGRSGERPSGHRLHGALARVMRGNGNAPAF